MDVLSKPRGWRHSSEGKKQVTATTQARWVQVMAPIGGLLLLFEVYIVAKWITGPNFKTVPAGPTAVPTWMKFSIIGVQVVCWAVLILLMKRMVITPWLRDRSLTSDGMLVLAAMPLSLYDAASAFHQPWFTYNSYFVNFGNPLVEIPGWRSFNEPGAMLPWPGLWVIAFYPCFFVGTVKFGCFLMNSFKKRWPAISSAKALGMLFASFVVLDILVEGAMMSMGWYDETGWPSIDLPGPYGHNPARNFILLAFLGTVYTSIWYFRNDRGLTFAERGVERVRQPVKAQVMRLLATVAVLQIFFHLCYNVPMVILTDISPKSSWHQQMIDNSFLNDHICGAGTPRLCPGQTTPAEGQIPPLVPLIK